MQNVSIDRASVRLMVGFHSHGSVLPVFAQSLAVLTGQLSAWGIRASVLSVEDCLVDRGRDRVAAGFLASDATHLLFVDGDIEFEPGDVVRLIAAGKDICAGAYRMKDDTGSYAVSLPGTHAEWDAEARALEVEGVGTGFMLIARGMFERMAAEMPEIAYTNAGPDGSETRMHAFFETRIVDGWRVSEDILFCRRWRALGGRVWVCPDIRLRHWGRRAWEGVLADDLAAAARQAGAA